MQEEIKKDLIHNQEKKQKEKMYLKELISENEKQKSIQDHKKIKEKEEERKLFHQFQEILDFQDEERKRTMIDRQKKAEAVLNTMKVNFIPNIKPSNNLKTEEILTEKLKKEEEKEHNQRITERKRAIEARHDIEAQIEQKIKKQNEDKLANKKLGQIYREKDEEYLKSEKELAEQKRKNQFLHAKELEKQIEDKIINKPKVMTNEEYQINKNLIEEAKNVLNNK